MLPLVQVIYHNAPGAHCNRVPLWELELWTCPDCTFPRELTCGRVIYNFRQISNQDYETEGDRTGRALPGGGRRVGWYTDPLCDRQAHPSPGPIGQELMTTDGNEPLALAVAAIIPGTGIRSPFLTPPSESKFSKNFQRGQISDASKRVSRVYSANFSLCDKTA